MMAGKGASAPSLEQVSRAMRLCAMGLTVDGTPFDLVRYPFLLEIFDEDSPDIVIRKGAQLGFTACMVLRAIDMSLHTYRRGLLYLMPTRDDVSDFSKSRFDRMMKENPALSGLVSGTDATNIKRIGETFLYFRGSKGKSALKSIPVDAVIFDERDEMESSQVRLALTRLDGSEFRHTVSLSTATLPDFGVDHDYQLSDQHAWMIRCRGCNGWTCMELDWPDSMTRDRSGKAYRACKRCRREILVREGAWVPAERGREKRGYWVSQLCSPTISPQIILDEFEDPGHDPREFANSRLGLPWADTDDLLDETTLKAVATDQPRRRSAQGPSFLGADVGKHDIHYFVGEKREGLLEMIDYGTVADFPDLLDVMRRCNVVVAVLDEMAETRKVREFKAAHGEVWGCWYSDAQRTGYDWGAKERRVAVNRTELLDQSHRVITQRLCTLPRIDDRWPELVRHMTNLARMVTDAAQTGLPKIRWVVRGGRKLDHFRHAFAYAVLAAEQCPISERARKIITPREYGSGSRSWMSA